MTYDSSDARDEMANVLIGAKWASDPRWAALGFSGMPHIEWQGREGDQEPSESLPYIIWAARHADGGQDGFSSSTGTVNFESIGTIVAQCKAPLSSGKGFEVAERMAIITRNAYKGLATPCGVWFRRHRIEEVGASDGWFIFNVFVDFTYNEVN